jgi:hypothetical protein
MNPRDFAHSKDCLARLAWARIYREGYGWDSTDDWLRRYGLTDEQVVEVFAYLDKHADDWSAEAFKRSREE